MNVFLDFISFNIQGSLHTSSGARFQAGEHYVRPYIGFAHRLGFGLACNFGYTQIILFVMPLLKVTSNI